MEDAGVPTDEAKRIESLKRFKVLDTVPERVFDDITQLAAWICKTPVALVSFVDSERQWFKSRVGLEATETPRNISFCGHAIFGSGIFEVKDALEDIRFADNPLVTGDLRLRFYAGAPLITKSGDAIGTLCVIDREARELNEEQSRSLKMLARHVMSMLELRISHEGVNDVNAHLTTLLTSMTEGMVLQQADGKIMECNPAAGEILGLTEGQLLGRDSMDPRWKSIREDGSEMPGGDHPAMVALRTGVVQRKAMMGVKTPEGRLRWIRINSAPIFSAGGRIPTHAISTFSDVTEEKRVHNELIKANEAALLAAKAKSEFLANVSHEIRTPLNGIIGICDLIMTETLDPALRESMSLVQKSGHVLMDLISDILAFSKIEAGKVDLESHPFDLLHTVREVVDLMDLRAIGKGLELSFDRGSSSESLWVLGDVTRFREILTNLVSNAIKFTHVGRVQIRLDEEAKSNKSFVARFRVEDTGIGIPAGSIGKLFQSFSQADASTTRKYGGSGLGLAICKGLCERMGGAIRVESQEGKGSIFTFEIPFELTSPVQGAKFNSANSPFLVPIAEEFPLRVLVAEDNKINQYVIQSLLKKLGYRSDLAENGLDVMRNLEKKTYDLILMDCHMPEMDGFETCDAIFRKYPTTRPFIVALTASAMEQDRERCAKVGMQEFLSKPIQLVELIELLKRVPRPKNQSRS